MSFISNFSYLSDPSFVVMRQRFLAEFDKLWFDCMNGDSRETGKLTPDGKPDPSVFSTEYNREGIRVGTAVCVIVRKAKRAQEANRSLPPLLGRGTSGADLLASLTQKAVRRRRTARAKPVDGEPLSPSGRRTCRRAYKEWPKVAELCAHGAVQWPDGETRRRTDRH